MRASPLRAQAKGRSTAVCTALQIAWDTVMGALIIFCAFWVPWRLGFTEAQDQAVRAHVGSDCGHTGRSALALGSVVC